MGSSDKADRTDDDALGGEERGRSPSGSEPNAGGLHEGPLPLNGRWSVRRKQEVVLRMLSGESIDSLSRELGVEPYRLEKWRDKALSGMEVGLKEREGDPVSNELDRAMKKIGELSMENELLRKRCEARESLRRRRSR
jgi:transposase